MDEADRSGLQMGPNARLEIWDSSCEKRRVYPRYICVHTGTYAPSLRWIKETEREIERHTHTHTHTVDQAAFWFILHYSELDSFKPSLLIVPPCLPWPKHTSLCTYFCTEIDTCLLAYLGKLTFHLGSPHTRDQNVTAQFSFICPTYLEVRYMSKTRPCHRREKKNIPMQVTFVRMQVSLPAPSGQVLT